MRCQMINTKIRFYIVLNNIIIIYNSKNVPEKLKITPIHLIS